MEQASAFADPNLCTQQNNRHKEYLIYEQLNDIGQAFVNSVQFNDLPLLQCKKILDCENDIIKEFDVPEPAFEEKLANPPQILIDFSVFISPLFTKELFKSITNTWPPEFIVADQKAKNLLGYLLRFVQRLSRHFNFVLWLVRYAIPSDWHGQPSLFNNSIAAFSYGYRKRKVHKEPLNFWAVLDTQRNFVLFRIENHQLIPHMQTKISQVMLSHSKRTFKVCDEDGNVLKRFVPAEPEINEFWLQLNQLQKSKNKEEATPFPLFYGKFSEPIPACILTCLYDLLTNVDTLVLRSLLYFKVTPIDGGQDFCEALFDIFAYAGKIPEFFLTVVAEEFENSALTAETILRTNSHVTNIFKIMYSRFGTLYFNNVILPLDDYLLEKGNIHLAKPNECDPEVLKPILMTVLNTIIKSLHLIPPEIRLLASILKSVATARFNNLQASFVSISSFFLLRFLTASIMNPDRFDEKLNQKYTTKIKAEILIPFTQILQPIFNLVPFPEKFQKFKIWEESLVNKFFPKLLKFVFHISDLPDEPVQFATPSKERFEASLKTVMNQIQLHPAEYREQFKTLTKMQKDRKIYSPAGWAAASFFESYFKANL